MSRKEVEMKEVSMKVKGETNHRQSQWREKNKNTKCEVQYAK